MLPKLFCLDTLNLIHCKFAYTQSDNILFDKRLRQNRNFSITKRKEPLYIKIQLYLYIYVYK